VPPPEIGGEITIWLLCTAEDLGARDRQKMLASLRACCSLLDHLVGSHECVKARRPHHHAGSDASTTQIGIADRPLGQQTV
jgi:hypothetical protein